MRRPDCKAFLLLLFVAAACADAPEPRSSAVDESREEHFAAFAEDLFAEMRSEPLDSTTQTEIGLFGDLSLGSGERVVMRRYRYRIDHSDDIPIGHMAFQVRDASDQYGPVPVVLTFTLRNDAWRLERTAFGDAVSELDPNFTDHAGHPESDEPSSGQARTPLHERLQAHLGAWLDAAIKRAGTSSGG